MDQSSGCHMIKIRNDFVSVKIKRVDCSQVVEIKKKLSEIYGGARISMAFIIVSKRINTRIFVPRGRGAENPKPGTIIDDVVTLPER